MTKFGITSTQYHEILRQQDGCCKLCGITFGTVKPNIDHDHKTGRIRGLLCSFCNRGLGLFKDNSEVLHSAALYVKEKFL